MSLIQVHNPSSAALAKTAMCQVTVLDHVARYRARCRLFIVPLEP